MSSRNRVAGLLALLLSISAGGASAQSTASVSGFVRDAANGETLLFANVIIEGTAMGAATNNSGFYTLSGLGAGSYRLRVSYLGYRTGVHTIDLIPGEHARLDVELELDDVAVGELVVEADREAAGDRQQLGVAKLDIATIRSLPSILEPDVFRSLQLLPGVKAASDYSTGLYIRGGSPDQTLILLDRTTVYNPTHFFGFFSTFNPDAIKDVQLYKGGFPAEYGGRIGSVVDVYNKDGNRRETHGRLALGLLASRAMVEGPIPRGSYMVAVRRSTLEPVLAALRAAEIDGIPNGFYFVDVNAKLNYDVSPDDKLSLSGYAGKDVLDLPLVADEALLDLSYGNQTLSLNWFHLFSQVLLSNFTLTTSQYFSRPRIEIASTVITRDNEVADVSAKGDLEYYPSDRHTFKGGFWAGLFTMRLRTVFDGTETSAERIHTGYGSMYAQHTYRPRPDWTLRSGIRLSAFGKGGYTRLEPRITLEHQPTSRVRLQAGYGRYSQFLTLISNEAFSGLDIWLTSDRGVPPAFGDQWTVGVKLAPSASIGVELESYFRTMRDLFQLDPFLQDAAGLSYDALFQFGDGYAYGIEGMFSKSLGRLTGFVGYTLGVTRRRFPQINDGAYYPPKYDRTHDVNVVANYDLSRRWRATAAFTFATGQAYTEPASYYRLVDNPLGSLVPNALISPFNRARLPSYHRLDLGFTRRAPFFGVGDYELQLQVINAYGRRNTWFYFFDFEDDNTVSRTEVPQIPVPVPNISFTVTF